MTDLNGGAESGFLGDSGSGGGDAISNTKWFLIEENKNFDVSQEDEIGVELNTVMDPSSPPEKGLYNVGSGTKLPALVQEVMRSNLAAWTLLIRYT